MSEGGTAELVQEVVRELNVDDQKARDGVGLLLFAIRFTTDQATFDAIKQAIPDAQELLIKALAAGGRTAEMLAVANPEAVKKRLLAARWAEDELEQLGALVLGAVTGILDAATAERVTAAVERATSA